jgi:tetratricopeptide (TPR) repeat protein
MGEAMNFCEQCGNKLNAGAKFCGKCGTAVPALQTETQKADVSANAETPAQKAYNEGLACKEAERYDEAIAHFTEALGFCTEADQKLYCDALFERGAMYVLKRLNNPAIADLTKVIQIDPNNYGAYYVRGLAYYDKDNYGMAIADYNKALQFSPDDDDFYRSRGIAYASEGDSGAAIADFTVSLEIEPYDARTYAYRGKEYIKTGDIAKARADLKHGLHIDPDNEMLSWLAEDLKKAERHIRTVSVSRDYDDDDDDFDDDDDDEVDPSDADPNEDYICECNNCCRIFEWKPILVRYKGAIGVFCSDSCAKEGLEKRKRGEKETTENLVELGLNIFSWLIN